MDSRTDTQKYRFTYKQTNRQLVELIYRAKNIETDEWKNGQTDGQTHTQTSGQTDGFTDRYTQIDDRFMDWQTDTQML